MYFHLLSYRNHASDVQDSKEEYIEDSERLYILTYCKCLCGSGSAISSHCFQIHALNVLFLFFPG